MPEVADQGLETQAPVQTEAEALASAMAGYDKTAREQPPVESTPEPSAEQESTPATETPESSQAPEPEAPAAPGVADLKAELDALKAKVSSTAGDADTVRKLHGEIGNINRTLKQLQSKAPASDAPAIDELAAALQSAEKAAEEFPEVVGPVVKGLKAIAENLARQKPAQAEPVDITGLVSAEVQKFRAQDEEDAKVALKFAHPDYATVRTTPEYKAWLSSKTPEYQEMFNTTWNPAVVSAGLTEFKDQLKLVEAKKRKTERLETAVTPQGVPQKAQPSKLPDEEGLYVGYYGKDRKRR